MHYLNIETSRFNDANMIGMSTAAVGAWVKAAAYCARQENGGKITGAAGWHDRQWLQACGLTLEEVKAASPLLRTSGRDLIVAHYPVRQEETCRQNRENGARAGKSRSEAKVAAARRNGANGGRPKNPVNNPSETPREVKEEVKEEVIRNGDSPSNTATPPASLIEEFEGLNNPTPSEPGHPITETFNYPPGESPATGTSPSADAAAPRANNVNADLANNYNDWEEGGRSSKKGEKVSDWV